MGRDGFCPRLRMTHRLENHVDILRYIGDFHFEWKRIRSLQEDIIEFIHKTPGGELNIAEVKNDEIFLTVLDEQPEVIHTQPGLKVR